jgi:hypothetical protein
MCKEMPVIPVNRVEEGYGGEAQRVADKYIFIYTKNSQAFCNAGVVGSC